MRIEATIKDKIKLEAYGDQAILTLNKESLIMTRKELTETLMSFVNYLRV